MILAFDYTGAGLTAVVVMGYAAASTTQVGRCCVLSLAQSRTLTPIHWRGDLRCGGRQQEAAGAEGEPEPAWEETLRELNKVNAHAFAVC